MVLQLPKMKDLPKSLPLQNAVQMELREGVPVFKASDSVQKRVEELLFVNRERQLSDAEKKELDLYEEVNDYLSFSNMVMQNMILNRMEYAAKH